MARKKDIPAKKAAKEQDGVTSYDVETPLWNRYYQAMRKRIRFPRYYKKAVNW